VSLRQLAEIAATEMRDTALAAESRALADEVGGMLREHAQVRHPRGATIYAYEIDGYGNAVMMDDANVPGLLGLPYLGAVAATDPVYQATRRFVLSEDNPYFFRGKAGEGIGGPHVGVDRIWPLSIIMRALTSSDDAEIAQALRTLVATHAGTGFMHESFHKDDPTRFTRAWFAWANTLFGELIVTLDAQRPHLLRG
jgi:meiotically up-regulated gene 157 (Mug157) protein